MLGTICSGPLFHGDETGPTDRASRYCWVLISRPEPRRAAWKHETMARRDHSRSHALQQTTREKDKNSLPRSLKFVHGGNLHKENSYFVWWEWSSTVPWSHPAFMFRQKTLADRSNSQDRQIRPTRGHPASMQSFPAILTCLQTSNRCKVELELCQPSQSTPLLSSPDWHLHSAHPFVAIIREIKPHQTPIRGPLPPLDKSKRVPEERYCLVSVQGAQSDDGE